MPVLHRCGLTKKRHHQPPVLSGGGLYKNAGENHGVVQFGADHKLDTRNNILI